MHIILYYIILLNFLGSMTSDDFWCLQFGSLSNLSSVTSFLIFTFTNETVLMPFLYFSIYLTITCGKNVSLLQKYMKFCHCIFCLIAIQKIQYNM